jgi:glucosamine 6-phosphate synthetase-like amidotransferase/phosphosugar isomerase protein
MCGISGYIGQSQYPDLSFKLATNLFRKLESRGTDAAGHYGVEGDAVYFHKQPLRSSQYIKTDNWQSLREKNCQILVAHARGASQGRPEDNRNNHPFLNQDRTVALIHNGRIPENEYGMLAQNYRLESGCDSEIILRIILGINRDDAVKRFPHEEPTIAERLFGIKEVFSLINQGHMATAVAENDKQKRLWLFRNKHRPLWIADTRDSLGQIWFCSTAEIWSAVVASMPQLRQVPNFSKHKLYSLSPSEVWMFALQIDGIEFRKFEVGYNTKMKNTGPNNPEFLQSVALLKKRIAELETAYARTERENSLSPAVHTGVTTLVHNVAEEIDGLRLELESV